MAWSSGLFFTRVGRRVLVGGAVAAILAVVAFPDAIFGVQSRFENTDETTGRLDGDRRGISACGAQLLRLSRSWASGPECNRTRRRHSILETDWDSEGEVRPIPRRAWTDRVPSRLDRQARSGRRPRPQLSHLETSRATGGCGRRSLLRAADDAREPDVRPRLAGAVLPGMWLHLVRGRLRASRAQPYRRRRGPASPFNRISSPQTSGQLSTP